MAQSLKDSRHALNIYFLVNFNDNIILRDTVYCMQYSKVQMVELNCPSLNLTIATV